MTCDEAVNAPSRVLVPTSDLDCVLIAQIAVAWAGEGGEEGRLGWWRTDLVSEFGGADLFRRLLPETWEWAVLQALREAARCHDAERRRRDNDPDRIMSLYSLGFELDERVEERIHELKRSGIPPAETMPVLAQLMEGGWDRGPFEQWIADHGGPSFTSTPLGRRIPRDPPADVRLRTQLLVAALAPFPTEYPLPHFRRSL